MIKIGINGFGRIGRLVLRDILKREDAEVVAINDLIEPEQLAYLFKYDSVHGKFDGNVEVKSGELIINNKKIRITSEKNPENLRWNEVGASVIMDCTGVFKEIDSASAHLKAGAEKVIISAPSKTAPMFVMGINHKNLTSSETIISGASCTTSCLAPMAKIMNDTFGIEEGLMTTVHAVTASQATVDQASKKNFRIGRTSLSNIIPSTTGAAIAVTKVIPELKGKLTGMAFRVPTTNVSVVDLTLRTKKSTTIEEIRETFKKASKEEYKGIVDYTEDAVVSQDFISNPYLCTFDAEASIALNENFFKLIGWYDNEYGYAVKLTDLAVYAANLKA